MRRARPGPGAARALLPVLVLVLLTGACSALPVSGPVHRERQASSELGLDTARFTAPGPGQGDAPIQIVNGFLTAMTANPAATSAARSFLSRRARLTWSPVSSTVVYRSATVTAGQGSTVDATLKDPRQLDARGGWLGDAGRAAGSLSLEMVKEHGEWRIADPPDTLLVPQYFLEQEYQPYDLYFFDPTQRFLVPDRVYVPRGEQTASQLVRALLDGPSAALAPVVRNEFPAGTQLDLSVSVTPGGQAEVPLSRQVLHLSGAEQRRAAAQLSWTLRQVPGVSEVRLAVDGTPVALSGGRSAYTEAQAAAYAPTIAGAPQSIYTLAKGRLAVLDPLGAGAAAAAPVSGAFGKAGYALRSFAVTTSGSTVTAVTANGRSALRTTVGRSGSKAPAVQPVYSGTDLLPPAYDALGNLWLVDRTALGARVVEVTDKGPQVVEVPGISGRSVTGFVVARTGTSLVAIVRGPKKGSGKGSGKDSGDEVMTSYLRRSSGGLLARATAARSDTALPSGMGRLQALAWTSPDDLAVLGRPAKGLSRVALISLDGSPGDPRTVAPDSWPGDAVGLVGSPDASLGLYLVTQGGRLWLLDYSGLWRETGVGAGQVSPTYVG